MLKKSIEKRLEDWIPIDAIAVLICLLVIFIKGKMTSVMGKDAIFQITGQESEHFV